jgi:hypothetical protein
MHKYATKTGLSGMSCNKAFSLPESWGGVTTRSVCCLDEERSRID